MAGNGPSCNSVCYQKDSILPINNDGMSRPGDVRWVEATVILEAQRSSGSEALQGVSRESQAGSGLHTNSIFYHLFIALLSRIRNS